MGERDWLAGQFEEHRTRLKAVAYWMLGSLTEADDAVQDAWLRLSRSSSALASRRARPVSRHRAPLRSRRDAEGGRPRPKRRRAVRSPVRAGPRVVAAVLADRRRGHGRRPARAGAAAERRGRGRRPLSGTVIPTSAEDASSAE